MSLPALPALETDRPMKHVRSDELRAAIAARPRQRSAARQAHIDDLTSRGFVPLSAYEQNMATLKNDNHGDDPREYDLDRAVLAPGFSEIPKAAEAGKPQTRGRSKR